ncbi:MAG: glycoside hydrolase family 2 [Actinomycetota bacterium]|nr:glycoside hydrolase family 2 [Actinomycetota bacterium]
MSNDVHPNPQLVRDSWTDLCGAWQFAYDDADQGLAAGWNRVPEPFDRTIMVPFPPESELSGIHDTGYHPVLWYRREVELRVLPEGQRLVLHLGAVDYSASVWVEGALVGQHSGGHTPFTCDITDAVSPSHDSFAVVVRAEDQPRDVSQPRGKQDWEQEPHDIWYHRTSGIWQPVWLETVAETHITELQWTPDVPGARLRAEVRLNRQPTQPFRLRILLRLDGEVLAEHTTEVSERFTSTDIAIPALRHQRDRNRLLWRPGSPTLVDAQVRLLPDSGVGGDEVASYLGLRWVGFEDGHFLLNGRSTYLRSVLAQGYWPESHLAAPTASALRREAELIKQLGFNSVRIHQKVEDPRFLYWCDRLGLMVWGEMPSAYSFDSVAVERLTTEWVEVLRRDRSHPCIVTWVPFNESWGIDDVAAEPAQRSYATALYHLTKAIDPTRPAISNDGWEHTESDIWSTHDYAARGHRLRHRYGTKDKTERLVRHGRVNNRKVLLPGALERGQPVMLTEFGGVRFDSSAGRAGRKDGWGYSEVRSSEALVARLKELVGAVLDSPALSGFCYTQLTDTEQEQNGLLTESREPKAPVAKIRKVITGPRGGQEPASRRLGRLGRTAGRLLRR